MRARAPRHAGTALRSPLRWLAAALAVGIATLIALAVAPAGAAASTTDAQLSLSGVAVTSSVLGGSEVAVHPGDTVDFKASALPTAGLSNIPALGPLVQNLLSPLLGQYQVVVNLGNDFPGGARSVVLGGPTTGECAGVPDLNVAFPNTGTYHFTWTVQYVLPGLLGCTKNGVSAGDLNLLKSAGVALNATNQWVGQVIVATNVTQPGLGLQLPGIGAAPSLPVIGQLPTLGLTLPPIEIPVAVPTLGLPGGGSGSGGGQGGGSSSAGGPDVECVPCEVMAGAGSGGGANGVAAPDANSVTQIGSGLADLTGRAAAGNGTVSGSGPNPSSAPSSNRHIDLAANHAPAASMPVLLAVIAIVALSLVTATYARLFVLRRN